MDVNHAGWLRIHQIRHQLSMDSCVPRTDNRLYAVKTSIINSEDSLETLLLLFILKVHRLLEIRMGFRGKAGRRGSVCACFCNVSRCVLLLDVISGPTRLKLFNLTKIGFFFLRHGFTGHWELLTNTKTKWKIPL